MQHIFSTIRILLLVLIGLILYVQTARPQADALLFKVGTVVDRQGKFIPRAVVRVVDPDKIVGDCFVGREGDVYCTNLSSRIVTIEISANGFAGGRFEVDTGISNLSQNFVLSEASIREEVVVTANRDETRVADVPLSISVIGRKQIEISAAAVIDDTLRQSAGFSIFRRNGSRNANPTTQGVSLRGVGSSGASRSIVLFDGVPLNDPFGGWIQWARVPSTVIDSVEVLRGGASSLYGDASLSGAVHLRPRTFDSDTFFTAEAFGGSQRTASGGGYAGVRNRDWLADISAVHFQTRGFIPVDVNQRGSVDAYAGTRNLAFTGKVSRRLFRSGSIFVRPSYFGEVRSNGTGLQTNRTHSRQLSIGGDLERPGSVRFQWRAFGGIQDYDQAFSVVNSTRSLETLTRVQRSPSQHFGASGQVTAYLGRHTFIAGIESRTIRGSSDEIVYSNGAASGIVGSGGGESSFGVFGQGMLVIGKRFVFGFGARVDDWQNLRGYTNSLTFSNNVNSTVKFVDRRENAISPQAAILFRASSIISFHASASGSFRSPTLNELYRGFRIGNILTLSNENLSAERALSLEAGITAVVGRNYLRVSYFRTSMKDAIANVTLLVLPNLITRQRQNYGQLTSAGIEADAETTIRGITFAAGYQFADSRIGRPGGTQQLRTPQIPQHLFTFQARMTRGKWTISVQGRASGSQFDDDLNLFRLEPFFQLDGFLSRTINEDLKVILSAENIFNSLYSVGLTPIRTTSSPALIRLGVRWN